MTPFVLAAMALSLERLCYIWVWRRPEVFRARIARLSRVVAIDPVTAVRLLFYAFKVLQFTVFVAWLYVFGHGEIWTAPRPSGVVASGVALIIAGQILNVAVFLRLGSVGVFYGSRFGHDVPWVDAFPFSWLKHPQYLGTVLSIWGLFVAVRFPAPDWYVLPLLETAYYALGARLEQDPGPRISGPGTDFGLRTPDPGTS